MSLAILFHFLCAQHVSHINISIIRSLRLCCWITTSVVLFSVRCVLEIWCGWFWVVSETCWAHKKWNKIASDIKLVFHSSMYLYVYGLMVDWESDQLSFVFTTVATHNTTLPGLSTGFPISMCKAWWWTACFIWRFLTEMCRHFFSPTRQ